MKHSNLQTSRCLLKQISPKHMRFIHQGLSNPAVTQYYDVHFATLAETQEQMDWYQNLATEQTGCWWAVFSQKTQAFCGAIGFNGWEIENQKAEIGCWLLPDFWGKGLMAELFRATVQYGFEKMNLHRIEGFVDAANSKCKNALQKLSFQHEGTMRECEFKNGAFLDVEIYSILKSKQK